MAAGQLDVPRLATFVGVPTDSVNELLSAPAADPLIAILSKFSEKVREYEELQSDKLKLKIELENAVRSGDAKSRAIKNSLDKSLEETSRLRQQLQNEGTAPLATRLYIADSRA